MGKFAVLGTGIVGQTLATKLIQLGHEVVMGARDASNERASVWAAAVDGSARTGTFRDAAEFGDVVVNATSGEGSLAALDTAGDENLAGKLIIDVSNPLDFSRGFPPSLSVATTDSLGEQIQRAHPLAKVVKALNTVNAYVMVDPGRVAGDHNLFIAGDDLEAKAATAELLTAFGWPRSSIIDLGGITGARALEAYVIFWVHLYGSLGTGDFNVLVQRAVERP